jgi:small subunit ribosomal protein S17
MQAKTQERRQRRTGTVISARNAKTIIVGVEWTQMNQVYRKRTRRMSKFVAHDELGTARRGDTVLIEETRPLSATKRWRLIEVVKKGELADISPEEAAAAGAVAATPEARQ